jgi:hypothetical protein
LALVPITAWLRKTSNKKVTKIERADVRKMGRVGFLKGSVRLEEG